MNLSFPGQLARINDAQNIVLLSLQNKYDCPHCAFFCFVLFTSGSLHSKVNLFAAKTRSQSLAHRSNSWVVCSGTGQDLMGFSDSSPSQLSTGSKGDAVPSFPETPVPGLAYRSCWASLHPRPRQTLRPLPAMERYRAYCVTYGQSDNQQGMMLEKEQSTNTLLEVRFLLARPTIGGPIKTWLQGTFPAQRLPWNKSELI